MTTPVSFKGALDDTADTEDYVLTMLSKLRLKRKRKTYMPKCVDTHTEEKFLVNDSFGTSSMDSINQTTTSAKGATKKSLQTPGNAEICTLSELTTRMCLLENEFNILKTQVIRGVGGAATK